MTKLRQKSEEQMMQDLLPFGFHDSGHDEQSQDLGSTTGGWFSTTQ